MVQSLNENPKHPKESDLSTCTPLEKFWEQTSGLRDPSLQLFGESQENWEGTDPGHVMRK